MSAALNIPEIWRYDGTLFEIYHFGSQGYVAALASRAFPMLTPTLMTDLLAQSKQTGQDETLLTFQAWLKQHE